MSHWVAHTALLLTDAHPDFAELDVLLTYIVDPGTTFESKNVILTIFLHLNLNLTMSNP